MGRVRRVVGLVLVAAAAGCGRSEIFDCKVAVAPSALSFGTVAVGQASTQTVTVSNIENGDCEVTGLGLGPGSDPAFSIVGVGSSLSLPAGASATVSVVFAPTTATPIERQGTLVFGTNDLTQTSVTVSLEAQLPVCSLVVSPMSVDFSQVTLGTPTIEPVALSNSGQETCQLSAVALAPGTDPGFSLAPSQATAFTVAPGVKASIPVTFEVSASAAPFTRTGTLGFNSNDPNQPALSVPLHAEIPRCALTVSPSSLDFGNIILNSSATDQVTVTNDGGLECDVSAIALGSGTDPDFSLPQQPGSFSVAPGGSASIPVTFTDLSGDQPPFLRQGTLGFDTGDPVNPTATVPLEAYVNTVCQAASQFIFTVDADGMFSRFDPTTLTFTDIAILSCPNATNPFSMAVDQNAVAWVLFEDGNIFQVDTSTAACQATSFQPDQEGQQVFGMSFVFQPTTGIDTLFVAGGGTEWMTGQDLATISFPSLVLNTIAPVTLGGAELAGTGDGQLWGFFPSFDSTSGITTLAQLDEQTAAVLQSFQYPSVTASGGFATKFWGGSFWLFLSSSVYEVPRATGVISTAIADTGRDIVGAGVSTCAPVQ